MDAVLEMGNMSIPHRNAMDQMIQFWGKVAESVPKGYRMVREANYEWPEDVTPDGRQLRREPDLSVILLPSHKKGLCYTDTPVWIAEVLSPSTEAVDRGEKKELYAKIGVQEYWIVDITQGTVEVYILAECGDDGQELYFAERVDLHAQGQVRIHCLNLSVPSATLLDVNW